MNKSRRAASWHRHKSHLGALLIILLVFSILFRRALFTGEFLLWGDPICYSHPLRTLAWGMIRQGQLPLWTPNIFAGYPLLSMAQLGLGYPLTWGYLFLPGYWAEQIYILAPYILAPVFTYAYCREIGRSRLASLLAGMSFGYGGLMFSPIGLNGMLPNAMMWLPLMLIAIERVKTHRLLPCLLLATFAYTMSVLSGIGQGFVYVGILAFAYALFVSLFLNGQVNGFAKWKPLAVTVGAALLAAGVAAFQILETSHAARYSVRRTLTYSNFITGSLSLWQLIKSWVEPINPPGDATSWTPALTGILALFIIIVTIRRRLREPQIFFWGLIAISGFFLMLGGNTPFYKLIYYLPVINRFRVPSRHAFEWTFALSILAAYGWDIARQISEQKQSNQQKRPRAVTLTACVVILAGSFIWWYTGIRLPQDEPEKIHLAHVLWKTGITILTLFTLSQAWQISALKLRNILLIITILPGCVVEPLIQQTRVTDILAYTGEQATYLSPSGQFLQQLQPNQNRIYQLAEWGAEPLSKYPRIDWVNRHVLFGIHMASGYEPLLFERYSVALGDGNWDIVNPSPVILPERSLLNPSSSVLDLLNVTHIVSYDNFRINTNPLLIKDGVGFFPENDPHRIEAAAPTILRGTQAEGDELVLVTSLADAWQLPDGSPVASIRIVCTDGEVIERELRAGIETAEWAADRDDVRKKIRHRPALIFEAYPGDAETSFSAYRYWTRLKLGRRVKIQQVEIRRTSFDVSVALWRASVYDSITSRSSPLSSAALNKLEIVWQQDEVIIAHNKNALPRAWLVAEAKAVDGVQALHAIRGESDKPFDPRRTALIETTPDKLPALPGGEISSQSSARIIHYEPNRLVIEMNSDKAAILVVSEAAYPGWEATLDGANIKIYTTDFLLRGVYVPAGTHRVEMRYLARHARRGGIISAFSLLLIAGLAITVAGKQQTLPLSAHCQ